MRQVPQGQKSYTLIGSGKLAKHMSHYLDLKGLNILKWSRDNDPEFNTLPILENQTSEERLQVLAEQTSTILLAINDDAIQSYTDRFNQDHTVVHFSGAFYCSDSIGLHPLMTFGPELYKDNFYEEIPFIIDQAVTLNDIFPGLNNPSHQITAENKNLYHCMCSMGGNFTQILLQQVFSQFKDTLNLPVNALEPYLKMVVSNSLKAPKESITGPFTRNDLQTIEKHKESLKGTPEADLYNAFEKYYKIKFGDTL